MALRKYKLGELIEQTVEINNALEFGKSDVKGMTITKDIIPTKANVDQTDFGKYLIVRPNDFIYNPRTHGKKIGLGFNNSKTSFIITWNNVAFRIKETTKTIVLPLFLFLHFNRSEWDRRACFDSWGSSTEVFSWESFCDMDVNLPDITIQQKYVNVYNSLLQNQKAYERGLNDLKLTCDAYIEKLRHELPLVPIGGYIEESDIRNSGRNASAEDVRGITTAKEFIETKADMEGVDLDRYKIVYPEHFAYVPDTSRRGDKISLAFNNSKKTYLVSSISTVFKVRGLIPQYLFSFFRRDEFNRYARFHSWGSARETFTFDDMREVRIPVPDTAIQRDIVNIFNAYSTRKGIYERLKTRIRDMCPILIRGAVEEGR